MMVLVHTEEELYASQEPAICVIGATSAEIDGTFLGTKDKVYVRTVLQNEACTELENRLFGEMIAEPATRGEATDRYADFRREKPPGFRRRRCRDNGQSWQDCDSDLQETYLKERAR